MLLGSEQKRAVEQYVGSLGELLQMTPENDIRYGQATLSAVSKMCMTLAGREGGEMAGEARGDAYMQALEDIPSWAVEEAVRKWYRGECGSKHDYRWVPAPAILRDIARLEQYRTEKIVSQMKDLLRAEELIEFSDDHCADMRRKLATVFPRIAS